MKSWSANTSMRRGKVIKDEDFQAFKDESFRFFGRVEAKLEGIDEHIKSVSESGKETRRILDDHKESPDAHGLGAAKGRESGVLSWIALGLAAVGTYLGIRGSHP